MAMGNIIVENEKREHTLSRIASWSFAICSIVGIVGCSTVESFSWTYGGIFVVVGFAIWCCVDFTKYRFVNDGGALTRRRLVDDDLRGVEKEKLERLQMHIYAKHGYNFKVNDWLYYLERIAKAYINDVDDYGYVHEVQELSDRAGCRLEQAELAITVKRWSYPSIDNMSEKDRNEFREKLESYTWGVLKTEIIYKYNLNLKVGYFNRNGEYGHEGEYYYDFKRCDWYKPTTHNLDEVYGKMSEIEKYNIDFIKAHEDEMN